MNDFLKKAIIRKVLVSICALYITGCANTLNIERDKITNVKSIAIVNFPEMKPLAMIGSMPEFAYEPDRKIYHFSDKLSPFFLSENPKERLPLIYPVDFNGDEQTGLLIKTAKETDKKSQNFHEELLKANPDLNFRKGFIDELTSSFQDKGINVTLLNDQVKTTPYFRWKAPKPEGGNYLKQFPNDLPAVDADLVVQVCPVIYFQAASALNSYSSFILIGVAVFNGRTKEFYGFQEIGFSDQFGSYHQYDTLVKDLDKVGPELYRTLLSFIPEINTMILGD